MPAGLLEEVRREGERGRYQSQSEVIRDAVRRSIEERYTVEEPLSKELVARLRRVRDRGEVEDDVRELLGNEV